MNEEEFICVKKKVRELTKVDLDNYGTNQMMRRLDGFISRSKVPSVAHYCKMIEQDAKELARLQDFLTINVSEFFRDTVPFGLLKTNILPDLLRRSHALNIWSAGCSNGSEAYSVAIMLEQLAPFSSHRILATDIDKGILSQAAAGGPYRPADVRNVSPAQLTKYFTLSEGAYRVTERVRKKVIFKLHDLTRDAFESGFDLIMCRNVVIYFNDETKRKLRRRFQEALKLNGVLFIGATETMLDATDTGFQRLSPCFYKKTVEVPGGRKPAVVAHA